MSVNLDNIDFKGNEDLSSRWGQLIKSDLPVLIDFWAPWCGPCKIMKPSVEQLSADLDGQLVVEFINADDAEGLMEALNIRSVPTLILLKGGEVVKSSIGASSKSQILSMVKDFI